MTPAWSASIMCANLARLEDELRALEAAGCHELHFDIMDGRFVPNFALGFDTIRAARSCSKLPCDAHLMIEQPERYIGRFAEAGCRSISVHVEACIHAQRALTQIREAGASPGIAINPATPLTALEYLLPFVDRVLVMTVDPGYAGQAIIPSAFERVRILRENIAYRKQKTVIQVDGNITAENCARLLQAGADNFVLGTASIFDGGDAGENLRAFAEEVQRQRPMV